MEVQDDQKIRLSGMWDTLKRYDGYIATVNFRCGLIASFSAAVFGGVLLKADGLLALSDSRNYMLALMLATLAILALLSIYWVVRTIWPDLSSNTSGSDKPSLLFFGSVAQSYTVSEYVAAARARTIDDLEVDLAVQVHEVAQITLKKFELVAKAAKCVKWCLAVMGLIMIFVLLDSLGIKLCLR